MICHRHRAIFIHIQKTGGNSVSAALGMSLTEPDKHFLARDLKRTCDPAIWNAYFKFAFVRNPWARLVSWYSMIDAQRRAFDAGQAVVNRFQALVLTRAKTFEEFLGRMDEDFLDSDGRKWIFRNQLDYLTGADGTLLVDYVGRTETLSDDFEANVRPRLHGIPGPIQRLNESEHLEYRAYYTPELARVVADRYAADIEAFGYRF